MDSIKIQSIIDKIVDLGLPFLFKFLAAILIYIIGKFLAKVISNAIERIMRKSKVDESLVGFTKNAVNAVVIIFTILAAVNKLGVQTTSFIAILGAAGLAIGMALQGTLANFASGVMLIIFRPFKAGDFISGGGIMGSVKEIQIFNTILAGPDNRKIIVPNSKLTGDTIINFSDIEERRIDLTFGISYNDDIQKAKDILNRLIEEDSRILKTPASLIAVSELADSSVNLVCRPWVKPGDYWGVYFDLLEKGKIALEEGGLSIPYPQNDVHVYNNNQ